MRTKGVKPGDRAERKQKEDGYMEKEHSQARKLLNS
jgi:hypothetical protein